VTSQEFLAEWAAREAAKAEKGGKPGGCRASRNVSILHDDDDASGAESQRGEDTVVTVTLSELQTIEYIDNEEAHGKDMRFAKKALKKSIRKARKRKLCESEDTSEFDASSETVTDTLKKHKKQPREHHVPGNWKDFYLFSDSK
jgi:hypothetical protein